MSSLPSCMPDRHEFAAIRQRLTPEHSADNTTLAHPSMQDLPACKHTAEMASWLQTQEALLEVLWSLDEQALPGCAAGLGPQVRTLSLLRYDHTSEPVLDLPQPPACAAHK